jgi:hypothetical protein
MTNKIARGDEQALTDNQSTPAAFDASALPAAGATRRSEIVSLEPLSQGKRVIGISCRYATPSGSTGGKPDIRVWVSCKGTPPADYTDTSWRQVGVTDGVITAAQTYAGGSGADVLQGKVLLQPDMIEFPALAASKALPLMVSLRDVPALWLYVEAAEIGDTTHPGTLTLGIVQQ